MATAILEYAHLPAIVRGDAETIHLHAQGEFGARLDELIAQIVESLTQSRQWQAVAGAITEIKQGEAGSTWDVFSLNRVPPKRTYTTHVRYNFVGRGKPRPFPLEDEE